MGRSMRNTEPVSTLRGPIQPPVPHVPPQVNIPQHHMHQLDVGMLQNGPVANSKSYKTPLHGSSSVYKPLSQSQQTPVNSTHTYTQAYSYTHNVQYGPNSNYNEGYNSYNSNYNSNGPNNYNGGYGHQHQSSVYQYNQEQQHFPNYPPPSHPAAPFNPYQMQQNSYPQHARPPVNNASNYNVQPNAYSNNMYGYNNYNMPPKQNVSGYNNVHPAIQGPQQHRQPQQHQVHPVPQQYAQVPPVPQPQDSKTRPFHTSYHQQPRLPAHAPAPPQQTQQQPQQSFHASSHFAPPPQQQQPEHDHPNSEGYDDYSSGSDGVEGGDESKGSKRSELVESPTTKQTYKQFFKQFKATEKEGLSAAKEFAEQNLELLPLKVHWKVYLELADLAKRENSLKLARKFYREVIKLQPYASQGWLEYAKMEEECGQLDKCAEILTTGLTFCPYNESLMVKGKHNRICQ